MGENSKAYPPTVRHEVGHAVAAIKLGGRVKEMNLGNRALNDGDGYTCASHPSSEAAFYHYAGSWTEAKFDHPDQPVEPDDLIDYFLISSDDLEGFKEATGIVHPPLAWHEKAAAVLIEAWDNGEMHWLAEQLIANEPEISLPNGQLLRREKGRPVWHGTDYHDVPDNGGGLVGPPPRGLAD